VLTPEAWLETGRHLLACSSDSRRPLRRRRRRPRRARQDRQPELDLSALDAALAELKRGLGDRKLFLEPGRFVVAPAGVLLARVTQTKGKGDARYIGIATGMNSLIRPALYGAYHEVVNLTRIGEAATELATIVGPICETADRIGSDRQLPPAEENDVMLIANAGAYGAVMSSRYNLREPAPEMVV
jgi:diaminopimelate decarboxylase/aspartate kinase